MEHIYHKMVSAESEGVGYPDRVVHSCWEQKFQITLEPHVNSDFGAHSEMVS